MSNNRKYRPQNPQERLINFASRVRTIALGLLNEGNDYDMSWHKRYAEKLINSCNDILLD